MTLASPRCPSPTPAMPLASNLTTLTTLAALAALAASGLGKMMMINPVDWRYSLRPMFAPRNFQQIH